MNPKLEELQHAWMAEDAWEGVAKAVSGCSNQPTARVAEASPS